MSAPVESRELEAWPPQALRDLLVAIAGDARARWRGLPRVRPGRPPVADSGGEPTRWQRAQRELRAVQRAEFALLLRRAARLRPTADATELLACRQGLEEALLMARADHQPWSRGLERLARRVIGGPPEHWPSAGRLARSAHALEPCACSRTLLAELLAAHGQRRAAAGLLARVLLDGPSRSRRRQLLVDLVRLLEPRRGDRTRPVQASIPARLRRVPQGRGVA